jgi:flagellar hook assembly protein FlgD
MSGDVVRKFWDIATPQATWDGRNESGNAVSSGVYLWQLDPAKKSGKIIVVR